MSDHDEMRSTAALFAGALLLILAIVVGMGFGAGFAAGWLLS
jgi:hypothetical protein